MTKGISLCTSAVIVALFVIGISAFFYWFIFARFLELHVLVSENEVERRTINMANVLLSYEGLVPTSRTSARGVFDIAKLQQMATYLDKSKTDKYAETVLDCVKNAKELDIGYPNSYVIFYVVDLETCTGDNCNGWVGAFKGPFSVNAMYITRFIDCLANNIFSGGISPFSLWKPWDLLKCWQNTISQFPGEEIFFGYTSIPSISSGYPVLIQYSEDEMHIGRLYVGVWQWA
jgi:hypothetical protein